MKILVCIKQVPDSEAKVTAQGDQPSWGEAALVINPFDEYAVEGALQQKEALNATVTAVCIGAESAKEALKHALGDVDVFPAAVWRRSGLVPGDRCLGLAGDILVLSTFGFDEIAVALL